MRFWRESFVAAKVDKKIIAPMVYQGTCNTALFESWVEKVLVPDLSPGQTLILDNASFHKSQKTKDLIEKAGCFLLFLPPYSPDLNPIEKFWAWLKGHIRENSRQNLTLTQAIDNAFKNV